MLLGACTKDEAAVPTLPSVVPTVDPTTTQTTTGQPPSTATTPTTSAALRYEPVFVQARCEFGSVPDQSPDCGYLEVPENRADPDSATIRLHVAVFGSTSDSPQDDPVVYLEGGPGGDALESIEFQFEDTFAPFLDQRDVIIFDQRGTGYSEPSLACQEVEDLTVEYLDDLLGPDESLALELEAEQACHDRLAADGVDFTAYNSSQSAADVDDLRRVLGYEEWNLYGISYGTKLALTIMRDHPEGVRSVVLDSVYPPERDLVTETPANFVRALGEFFAACEEDESCSATYPDLETRFFTLVDELNGDPITVTVSDALTLDTYEAVIDGYGLMGATFQGLYSIDVIRYLPRMIADLESAGTFVLGQLVSNSVTNRGFISSGYYSVVQCREEAPFSDIGAAQSAIDAYPELGEFFDASFGVGPGTYQGCEIWETGQADPIDNASVVSDIPTFVTTGLYDPITPPSWGEIAAAGLSNSFYMEFFSGHAASATDDCAQTLMLAFMDDPSSEPSDACVSDMGPPEFQDPALATGPSGYVEFDVDGLPGAVAVYPEGWDEVNDGVWARGLTDLDTTVLLALGVDGASPSFLSGILAGQFGLDVESSSAYSANGLDWTIYEGVFTGAPVSAAFADTGGGTLTIILVHDPAEVGIWDDVLLEILDRSSS